MAVAAKCCNSSVVEIEDSQESTQNEAEESLLRGVCETQSQPGVDDDVVICDLPGDRHIWTTGFDISPPPLGRRHEETANLQGDKYECSVEDCNSLVRVFYMESQWKQHMEKHEREQTCIQAARKNMAGRTPWATQVSTVSQNSLCNATSAEPLLGNVDFEAWRKQLLETQELDPETQAAEEVVRTAGDPDGQQSSPEGGLEDTDIRIRAKNPGAESSAVEDAHQTPGGTTSVLDRPSGQFQKEFEAMGRAVLSVEEELQNQKQGENCESQEGIGEREQAEGGVRGSSAASSPSSRDVGPNKRRREKPDTSSSEQQARKRQRREAEDCLEPEPELEEDVVGLFSEKVVAGLLDLASTSGIMVSMTRTADKVVFKVRLDMSSQRGTKSRDSFDPDQEEEPYGIT
ncbi:hypothetical protein JX266_014248 [Neoarthrinium moseri]|nr:hypothetical protein JX266_014248 [Neoarthrinium moseri]